MALSEAALGDVQAELGEARTISDKLSDEQTVLKRKVDELEEENRLHYADRCTAKHQRIVDANADKGLRGPVALQGVFRKVQEQHEFLDTAANQAVINTECRHTKGELKMF